MSHDSIYLDYNSTTPPYDEVISAISDSLQLNWQNPSTSYKSGKKSMSTIEHARESIARLLNVESGNVIFTSGGTESNHMVINSIVNSSKVTPHIITSNIEHDNVLKTLENFKINGLIDLTIIPVSFQTGTIEVTELLHNIKDNTRLITLMLANNETGVIFPVKYVIEQINLINKLRPQETRILIHTDACQAIGKIVVDLRSLDVDYATIAGHKFYGPRIGAVYAKSSVPLTPIFLGGKQERSLRPGTQNTALIVGMGKAAEIVNNNLTEEIVKIKNLRDMLERSLQRVFQKDPIFSKDKLLGPIKPLFFGVDLCKEHPYLAGNFSSSDSQALTRLPNTTNVVFQGPPWFNSAVLLQECELLEATRGSACHADSGELSHEKGPIGSRILIKCGYSEELAATALRLSLGRLTTSQNVLEASKLIHTKVKKIVSE